MPLDPQAEIVIGLVKQAGLPEFWQLTPDQAREQYLLRVQKMALKHRSIARGPAASPGRAATSRSASTGRAKPSRASCSRS